MPMVEGESSFRIEGDLGQARLWELVEANITLVVECVSCHRRSTWPPRLIKARLAKSLANRLSHVAGRLSCAACRSRYVRLFRDRGPGRVETATGRPDPAARRRFGEANLDPNARKAGRLKD